MSPAHHASDDQMDAATWCRHLVPDRSVYAFLADHRHQLFPPEAFVDLTRHGAGHPSVPAEVVATVMVLQALEGLSDREAISALRRDIAWKVAKDRVISTVDPRHAMPARAARTSGTATRPTSPPSPSRGW